MSRAGAIRLSRAGVVCLACALLVLSGAPGKTGRAMAAGRAALPAGTKPAAPRAPDSHGDPIRLVAGGTAGFAPARRGALDRVAAAVDGAESSHGTNPAMWRADLLGPQGPMQISAAAAADVGGGDRFDIGANLALGRAYLAHMYRRYGSWADAIAAYNWGPGRIDAWIRSGRPADRLPEAVERYTGRVLLASAAAGIPLSALNFAPHRPGLVRPLARWRRVPRLDPRDPVQLLYSQLMQASAAGMR